MDAPVSPAGLPAIGISAAREDTEEIASLPAMSVQDDGTDVVAIGPREDGQALILTAEALAVMGLNDPRRNAPGAVSEWAQVTSPTHALASLAGSPQQFNSAQYSPSEFHNVPNYYQNNVLAPSLHQQFLLHQNDSATWANHNHTSYIRTTYFRHSFNVKCVSCVVHGHITVERWENPFNISCAVTSCYSCRPSPVRDSVLV